MGTRIHYECRDRIGWLRLDDGKANAMQTEWCDEVHAALDEAGKDESLVVVVSGRPGFFSGGLDLKVLPGLPIDALRATTDRFVSTMRRVFLYEKPVVAASAGHAIAGGMMLFLAADLRLAADETVSRYGLNEATTGIPLAGGTLGICTAGIPPAHHTELILHGRLVDAREAHARGIVHELARGDALLERAEARARDLFDLEPSAYRINKRLLRQRAFDQAVEVAAGLAGDAADRNLFAGLAR